MHVRLLGHPREYAAVKVVLVTPGTGLVFRNLPADNIPAAWFNADGSPKTFAITFFDGEAFVPPMLGERLIRGLGLARRGTEPDPRPSFEQRQGTPVTVPASTAGASTATSGQSGIFHGAALDRYSRWLRDATPAEIAAQETMT
jgi:hypothetical protein